MEFVDTHCHIQSAGGKVGERGTRELWAKAPELTPSGIIANAAAADVAKLLCVGCDLEDSRLAVDFVQDKPQCWAAIGIHPHEAQQYVGKQEKLTQFAGLAKRTKVVAIGECGLDYYYGHSPKADQADMLKFQIELAMEHDLPMVFHVREAFDDFWPIFDTYHSQDKPVRGVLHSFTDNEANLIRGLDRGLHIGVNGIATFSKQPEQLAVYESVPLERLCLETDAPYLTPSPYRGSINEPKYVRVVAEFVADLKGVSLEEIAAASTQNAKRLFGV